jgi:hypothetical protein
VAYSEYNVYCKGEMVEDEPGDSCDEDVDSVD